MQTFDKTIIPFFVENSDKISVMINLGDELYWSVKAATDADWAASGASGGVSGAGLKYVMKQIFFEVDYYFKELRGFKKLLSEAFNDGEDREWVFNVLEVVNYLLRLERTSLSEFEGRDFCEEIRQQGVRLSRTLSSKQNAILNFLLIDYKF